MFNVGFTELLLVGVIALIFIGPQQLPEVARTIGRLLNEFKRATSDFQSSITTDITREFNDNWQETRHQLQQLDNPGLDTGPLHAHEHEQKSESAPADPLPVGVANTTEGKKS